jgi:RNA-directed DNA polymerase
MLTALEEGVGGKVWYSLMDKVWKPKTLAAAARQVRRNGGAAGVDGMSVEWFEEHQGVQLRQLYRALKYGDYDPQAIRRVWIPKLGSSEQRPLGIPCVIDRVVQAAIVQVIQPIFEAEFAEHSYGFRPQRGCKDALRQVDTWLRSGKYFVVDVDLKSYFDTIPHARLMERLRARVSDATLLGLVERFLKAGIMDGREEVIPEAGAPQGAVLSPLLSNIYLNPLDHLMTQGGWSMVRYADDFVILCQSRAEAAAALARVREWCADAGLVVHPTKTKIVDVRESGFDFLGYHFRIKKPPRLLRLVRRKSLNKLHETIRQKTSRVDGRALSVIIEDVNRTLRGWFEYFKHCFWNVFSGIDGWVRQRIRGILRKREKRPRYVTKLDLIRYPNKLLAGLGLFSLEEARKLALASNPDG